MFRVPEPRGNVHERAGFFAFRFEPSAVNACLPFLCGCGLWSRTVVDPVSFPETDVAWSKIDLGNDESHCSVSLVLLFYSCIGT